MGICAILHEENRCQAANLLLEKGKESLAELLICVTITTSLGTTHTADDPRLEVITKADLNQYNLQDVKEILLYSL